MLPIAEQRIQPIAKIGLCEPRQPRHSVLPYSARHVALRNRAMALHDVDHRPPTEIDGLGLELG
jgi:hypothetical protein